MEDRSLFEDVTSPALGAFHRDPHDSEVQAAVATYARSGTDRYDVLLLLVNAGGRGLTDEEGDALLGRREGTMRKRRREFVQKGWAEASTLRRPTSSGVNAVVWVLTGSARSAIRAAQS